MCRFDIEEQSLGLLLSHDCYSIISCPLFGPASCTRWHQPSIDRISAISRPSHCLRVRSSRWPIMYFFSDFILSFAFTVSKLGLNLVLGADSAVMCDVTAPTPPPTPGRRIILSLSLSWSLCPSVQSPAPIAPPQAEPPGKRYHENSSAFAIHTRRWLSISISPRLLCYWATSNRVGSTSLCS